MTSEEYKLQGTSMKKKIKRKDSEKGKPIELEISKQTSSEISNQEKKQPLLIIKMVMKGFFSFLHIYELNMIKKKN